MNSQTKMKLKSELYIYETMMLLEGINLKAEYLYKLLMSEKRKAQLACFFAPWTAKYVWSAMSIKCDVIMQQMNMLSELRQKIMECEGVDDDMRSITLEQMIEKHAQINA